MRLMWVQQWAVLPVIVEDRDMLDDNGQGGRLPPGGQPMDPSARARLSEREGPFQPRTSLPYPVILYWHLHILLSFHFRPSSVNAK